MTDDFLLVHGARPIQPRDRPGPSPASPASANDGPAPTEFSPRIAGERSLPTRPEDAGRLPALERLLSAASIDASVSPGVVEAARSPRSSDDPPLPAFDVTPPAGSVRVGLWDLSGWLVAVRSVLREFNAAGTVFRFHAVDAAAPIGVTLSTKGVASWLASRKHRLTRSERRELAPQTMLEDFVRRADAVRRSFELQFIIGITPHHVAGLDPDPYWNHYSASDGRVILASTAGLREYARDAGRPFEVAVAGVGLGQLLQACVPGGSLFHGETRGCLFDYCEDLADIRRFVSKPAIDPDCVRALPAGLRQTACDLVSRIASYTDARRPSDSAEEFTAGEEALP